MDNFPILLLSERGRRPTTPCSFLHHQTRYIQDDAIFFIPDFIRYRFPLFALFWFTSRRIVSSPTSSFVIYAHTHLVQHCTNTR